jgi:hypothetical protein
MNKMYAGICLFTNCPTTAKTTDFLIEKQYWQAEGNGNASKKIGVLSKA